MDLAGRNHPWICHCLKSGIEAKFQAARLTVILEKNGIESIAQFTTQSNIHLTVMSPVEVSDGIVLGVDRKLLIPDGFLGQNFE
jgi:hypothetical protein